MMEVLRDTVRQQRLLGAREHIIHPSAANPPILSSALPPHAASSQVTDRRGHQEAHLASSRLHPSIHPSIQEGSSAAEPKACWVKLQSCQSVLSGRFG